MSGCSAAYVVVVQDFGEPPDFFDVGEVKELLLFVVPYLPFSEAPGFTEHLVPLWSFGVVVGHIHHSGKWL